MRQLDEPYPRFPPNKFGYVKVIAPHARLKSRRALLAWRRIDELEKFDRERILRFVPAWQDKGLEDVP